LQSLNDQDQNDVLLGEYQTVEHMTSERFESPQGYTPRHLAQQILTNRHALEGERKVVTVLFCDLVNSTALAERIGADRMHRIINQFFEMALHKIHQYEGTINQFLGDGFMALFGAPLAYEDHARRAVLAALDLQNVLRERGGAFRTPTDFPIKARIGLNTGPVVVGSIGDNLRMDYTAIGDTTNLAARLQGLAEPDFPYLSETTFRLAQAYVDADYLGLHSVKGKQGSISVYRAIRARSPATAWIHREERYKRSPLIGRSAQLIPLQTAIDRLIEGQGSMIAVLGEAGLGKSRLLSELKQPVKERGVQWWQGHALSYTGSLSYWPFLEIIKEMTGIVEQDSETVSWAKLEVYIRGLFPHDPADILPYVATLLGLRVRDEFDRYVRFLSEQAMGQQIFSSMRRLISRLTEAAPVVLVLEDVHWVDFSSRTLLEHLLPLTLNTRLLICWVSRFEDPGQHEELKKAAISLDPSRYIEIALSALTNSESRSLLEHLLPMLPAPLPEKILEKAEGNPFFVEEVVRIMIEGKAVIRNDLTGHWQAGTAAEELRIPDTIEAVIMARIDRLQDDVKDVLKIASVVGRTFFYKILESMFEVSEPLEGHLHLLEERDLIREKCKLPEWEYFFKHALIQQATYDSILLDRRQSLHRGVAQGIERLFGDRLDDFYGVLAYHYTQAEDWKKAQVYLIKAGDQAGQISADSEALSHYEDAITACRRALGDKWDPLEQATLERKIGEALFRRGKFALAADRFMTALRLLGRPYPATSKEVRKGIFKQVSIQLVHRLHVMGAKGQKDRTDDHYTIMFRLPWINFFLDQERFLYDLLTLLNWSERRNFFPGIAMGAAGIGMAASILHQRRLGRFYLNYGVEAASRSPRHPIAVTMAEFCAACHWQNIDGDFERAYTGFEKAVQAAEECRDITGWSISTFWLSWNLRFRGKLKQSLALTRQVVTQAENTGENMCQAYGLFGNGCALFILGDAEAALQSLYAALELFRKVPAYILMAASYAWLGRVYLCLSQLDEARPPLLAAYSLLQQHAPKEYVVGEIVVPIVELWVRDAETKFGNARVTALKEARRLLQVAAEHAHLSQEVQIYVARTAGTFEWVQGRPRHAQQWWEKSANIACRLGAPNEAALTYIEMGRRMNDPCILDKAVPLLKNSEAGAYIRQLDLARQMMKA
jgi:class 3 adenylate cyclase/tetratricopeptide (TPR) repeat protein